jgi:hypothetical protein
VFEHGNVSDALGESFGCHLGVARTSSLADAVRQPGFVIGSLRVAHSSTRVNQATPRRARVPLRDPESGVPRRPDRNLNHDLSDGWTGAAVDGVGDR